MRGICNDSGRSNTGLSGISESTVRGRPCFKVSYRPKRNERRMATIYFGPNGVTREDALQRAKDLRFAAIASRMKREGRATPWGQRRC